jgi:type VI secretion system protein ImpM
MLQKLIASRLITPPAIWGKLPGHSDFVRSAMRHGESEGWQDWLTQQDCLRDRHEVGHGPAAPPVAFVLPPHSLPFAPRRFVVGVISPSIDAVGRHYPVMIYQLAHSRWVQRHFEGHAQQPRDWLFWLARALARHVGEQGMTHVLPLRRTVHALWSLHEPAGWNALGGSPLPSESRTRVARAGVEQLLDRVAGPAPAADVAAHLRGVRFMPWADWPQCLANARVQSAFWQQDAQGGFVNATNRLQTLWGEYR